VEEEETWKRKIRKKIKRKGNVMKEGVEKRKKGIYGRGK
jgi:hypothetical protein